MAVTRITQQELLKLARLSSIKLEDTQVEPLRTSLEGVLGYASRLQEKAAEYPQEMHAETSAQQENIFRPDQARVNSDDVLSCAPVHANNYFVVPVIISNS